MNLHLRGEAAANSGPARTRPEAAIAGTAQADRVQILLHRLRMGGSGDADADADAQYAHNARAKSFRRYLPQHAGWLAASLVAISAAVGGWTLSHHTHFPVAQAPAAPAARAAAPLASPAGLQAEGFVVATRQATVSAEDTGRVMDLRVSEGSRVARGQVIAQLDARVSSAQVDFAQSQLSLASKNAAVTLARVSAAGTLLSRRQILTAEGWNSRQSLDDARDSKRQLEAQLEADHSAMEVAERQLEVSRRQLAHATILAPFDGQVTAVSANVGEIVSPISAAGGFTRTGICTIVDFTSLQGEVQLSERYLGRVAVGTPVSIRFPAFPDTAARGKVAVITPAVDRGTAAVQVRIAFDEMPSQTLPGMRIDLTFE